VEILQSFQRLTTDRLLVDHEGLGLGLSIVQAIVIALQGEVHMRPKE